MVNFDSNNQIISGSYYQNNYSQEENKKFTAQFEAITLKMVACLDQSQSVDSEQMQAAVQEHFDFCMQFWRPTKEAYKSLAMSFVLPTGYNETYEGYREGLGKYIYEAMVHFADTRL